MDVLAGALLPEPERFVGRRPRVETLAGVCPHDGDVGGMFGPDPAGERSPRLAEEVAAVLPPAYGQHIHLIGHSHGTVVNATALDSLAASGIRRPDRRNHR